MLQLSGLCMCTRKVHYLCFRDHYCLPLFTLHYCTLQPCHSNSILEESLIQSTLQNCKFSKEFCGNVAKMVITFEMLWKYLLEANEFPCKNVTYEWKGIENLGNNSDFYKDEKKPMKKKDKHPNPLNLLGLSSFNQLFMTSSLVQTLMPGY